jgi:hypothetical protein
MGRVYDSTTPRTGSSGISAEEFEALLAVQVTLP